MALAASVRVGAGQAVPAQAPPAAAPSAAAPAPPAPAPPVPTPPAGPKAVPAVLPAVVARVNGQDITKDDFEKLIRMAEANAGRPVPAERRDDILRRLLDDLVVYTLLNQEAQARGLTATDTDIDAKLQEIRQQFPTKEAFETELKDRGMTLDGLRKDIGRDVTMGKVMDAELAALHGPTDEDAKSFYTKHPDRFAEEESIRASHILITLAPDADAAAKAKARGTADSVLAKAKAGQDFAALAKEFSQDPGSGAQGGDLNYFTRGRMVPEFEAAAFSLQPGQVSDIVTTKFGYHIIKVTDRKPARVVPFEDVAAQIKNYLQGQNKQDRQNAFIDELKKKAKIEVLI